MSKKPINEDGLIPDLVGGAGRLVGKAAGAVAGTAKNAYGKTDMAARGRAKKAVGLWVTRMNRDWVEYAATQDIKQPTKADVFEFMRDEYGRYSPELKAIFDKRIADLGGSGETTDAQDSEAEDFRRASQGETPTADRSRAAAEKAAADKAARKAAKKAAKNGQQPQGQETPTQAAPASPQAAKPAPEAPKTASAPDTTQAAQPADPKPQAPASKVHVRPRSIPLPKGFELDSEGFAVPRHDSSTINFDDYEAADEYNAEKKRNDKLSKSKQAREAYYPQAKALLESSCELISYANEKRTTERSTLETIEAMAESYGESSVFVLARRIVAEHATDPAVLRQMAFALLEDTDPVLNKNELNQIFVQSAQAMLRNSDLRYATIRLDPKNPKFDQFFSNVTKGSIQGGSSQGGTQPTQAASKGQPQGQQKPGTSSAGNAPFGELPPKIDTGKLGRNLHKLGVSAHAFDDIKKMVRDEGMERTAHALGAEHDKLARRMLVAIIDLLISK